MPQVRPPRRIQIMGIVNLTPDSFSDGGNLPSARAAIAHARRLIDQGADIIDLGAESTRPGSHPVPSKTQLARIMPVLLALKKRAGVTVSIDTQSATVAEHCLAAGADIINDVSALRHDSGMAGVVAAWDCKIVLMHMRGTPRTMQKNPRYTDVIRDILAFFRVQLGVCAAHGIARERLILDPGLGFGKTLEHNLEILRRLPELRALKCPLLIGASRKSFLGKLSGQAVASQRVAESVAAGILAVERGAAILRVHDVAEHVAALRVAGAISPPR